MRDPQLLGEKLLSLRSGSKARLSNLYDKNHVGLGNVPQFDQESHSLVAETSAAYRQEFPDGIPVVSDDPGGV